MKSRTLTYEMFSEHADDDEKLQFWLHYGSEVEVTEDFKRKSAWRPYVLLLNRTTYKRYSAACDLAQVEWKHRYRASRRGITGMYEDQAMDQKFRDDRDKAWARCFIEMEDGT